MDMSKSEKLISKTIHIKWAFRTRLADSLFGKMAETMGHIPLKKVVI